MSDLPQVEHLPDCMKRDGAKPCLGYQDLHHDLNETFKAVLLLCGPIPTVQVLDYVLAARERRTKDASSPSV